MSDEEILKAGPYRSKCRLPALCYLHKENNAAILRSSQPMAGMKQKRSKYDQHLLKAADVRFIFDARPKKNALASPLQYDVTD